MTTLIALLHRSTPLVGALLLAGCATTASPPTPTSAPAPAAGAAATPGPGPAPGAASATPAQPLKPFTDIVKDATVAEGFFSVWKKDEKVWLEIPQDQIGKPFYMTVSLSRGLGERMLFGGLMGRDYSVGGDYLVELRRVGNTVQLLARNTRFVAPPGSPEERAVKNGFSDSLLGAAPVVSTPHPQRNTILIDGNALLLADIPRGAHAIERAYRNVYAFDRANSYIAQTRANADRTTLDVTAHYAQARIPLPAPVPSATAPFFPAPTVIEDPRSLFLGYLYTFTRLPEKPMQPRLADARIGHFVTTKFDFSAAEDRQTTRRHYVERWRLEKKDPAAALSEPVKPITFWIDREVPVKYRAPITAGILEWNKAFERVGFKDAIVVKQQPDDADFDTLDALHASIKWLATATPSFGAIGPSHVDPRSGEILDADIGIDANITRNIRYFRTEVAPNGLGYLPMYDERTGEVRAEAVGLQYGARACAYLANAASEASFGLALLEARGEIEPDSPKAEQFVANFLKDVTMHEVGHTLGLRHNFRASTIHTLAQLSDPDFTENNSLTASVMEYTPINIALKSERQGRYFTSTLGPYDYWAIEYAYRPLAPEQEHAELARIAARSNEPDLAFATDGDVIAGLDPAVNQQDLGSDPLAFYRRRVALSRELWSDLEQRKLKDGDSYEVLRRRSMPGFTATANAMGLAAKYVGGTTTLNDKVGSPRLPLTPIAAAQQREALALLADALFRSDSFKVAPDFMRRMAQDRLEVESSGLGSPSAGAPQLSEMVLAVQRDVLNRLMSPTVAQRVVDSRMQIAQAKDALGLAELYGTLQSAIWTEARTGAEPDALRRALQREHLRRIAGALIAPSGSYPSDAHALLRVNARQLRDQLQAAGQRQALSPESRAHYADAADTLTEALKAPLQRGGV